MAKSSKGEVVILKLPLKNNHEKLEFYEQFNFYENILFFGINDVSPFLQVIILAADKGLIEDVKNYVSGVEEIYYQDLFRSDDPVLIGNKLLLPFGN